MRLDIQRQLAAALAEAGLASLRYDRRGVGASGGSFLAAGLHHNVEDAAAALRALAQQDGVDPDHLFVVGHSEGALVAARLLAEGHGLAGGVLLSPPARRGDDLLLWQAARLAATLPRPVRALLRLVRVDLVAKVARTHERIRRTREDVVRIGGVRTNARWVREFMAHDPREDLRRITVPVLALVGGKDLQVPPEDVDAVAGLVAGPVERVVVDDVSHVLRSQASAPSVRAYRRDVTRPVDPRVVGAVVGWLRQQVEARSATGA